MLLGCVSFSDSACKPFSRKKFYKNFTNNEPTFVYHKCVQEKNRGKRRAVKLLSGDICFSFHPTDRGQRWLFSSANVLLFTSPKNSDGFTQQPSGKGKMMLFQRFFILFFTCMFLMAGCSSKKSTTPLSTSSKNLSNPSKQKAKDKRLKFLTSKQKGKGKRLKFLISDKRKARHAKRKRRRQRQLERLQRQKTSLVRHNKAIGIRFRGMRRHLRSRYQKSTTTSTTP